MAKQNASLLTFTWPTRRMINMSMSQAGRRITHTPRGQCDGCEYLYFTSLFAIRSHLICLPANFIDI